ncbi:MAG: 3-dehydroquinate synthase [Nitrospirota bacterium]
MRRNIILTGFMGTGKTEVGRLMAQMLDFQFVDTDQIIEERQGITIREIFDRYGEPYFRNIERMVVEDVSRGKGQVIATGGGVVLDRRNMVNLKRAGLVVCLWASPSTIYERSAGNSDRPLLNTADPMKRIKNLLKERDAYYKQADISIDTTGKSPEMVASEVIRRTEVFESRVIVALGDRSYDIIIGRGILSNIGTVAERFDASKVAIISNPTVFTIYGDVVVRSFNEAGYETLTFMVGDGEEYKTLDTVSHLYDELLSAKLDRKSGIIALGGGVVGDIGGFVAATYMRGISYIQVPTTLLAQVDSSVGGKTGVNHPLGKNMIGAFYQPKLVWIDIKTLNTLPEREFREGLAEVIKYGMIADENFFSYLEENIEKSILLQEDVLSRVIERSCEIKADVVSRDERESGLRSILNFGHTIGHAIETVTDYRTYRHGEAISIGMVAAARIAHRLGLCNSDVVIRLKNLIERAGLLTELSDINPERIIKGMEIDKKSTHRRLRFVLPTAIGNVIVKEIEDYSLIKEILAQ